MRKILTALFVVLALFATSAFAACSGGNPTYYKVTFTATEGVEYVLPVDSNGTTMQSGADVLEGYTVVFEVNVLNGYVGAPVVKAGDTELTPVDGKYSFKVSAVTAVTVSGIAEDDGGDGDDDQGGSEGDGDGSDIDDGTTVPETTSHTLIYADVEGVNFTDMSHDGTDKVEEGDAVKFKLSLSTGYTGALTVKINGTAIFPDTDDFYSFSMPKRVTTVTVEGVSKMKQYNVTFSKGVDEMGVEGRVKYFTDLGDVEEGFTVYAGTELKFTVNVSSYYTDDYYIRKNTEIITPDEEGVYTVYVTGHTDINAYGLEMDKAFVQRADGGKGTPNNPYKISKPIDLYYMAALINSDFYTGSGFNVAYYELTNDIDLEGEQLFVIGDTITSSAFFGGNFNGNGHTISNYYIEDSIVDQESFVGLFLPYIGLFGFVQPGDNGAPAIYDLHLSDFTISIDASGADSTFVAGGICGIAIGATISACSVTNATISADADYGYFGYIGGIAGVHQSYYFSDSLTRYYATIASCYTDVEITGDSGYVYGAGGIAGYMLSHEEKTNAYVLNCYATGNVSGAINVGGIVGLADSHTAIMGCYATGDVEAYSAIELTGSADIDSYAYARAGGIVGDVGYSSIVSDSFFSGEVYASAAGGSEYAQTGAIAGNTAEAESIVIDAKKSFVVNAYGKNDAEFDDEFFATVLGWDAEDWVFASDEDYEEHRFANDYGYPVINYESAEKTFIVKIDLGEQTYEGGNSYVAQITNTYIPMSYWAVTPNADYSSMIIPEFLNSDEGLRSYGYFFDEDLTQPVPHSYIPTHDVTLYAGFADYTEVEGIYYVQTDEAGSGVYLELDSYGMSRVVEGAREFESYYTYDGENIFLFYTTLARYANIDWSDSAAVEGVLYYYYTFKATVDGDLMTIWDTIYFLQPNALTAIKEKFPFAYTTYYDDGGRYYTFNTDGTGVISGAVNDTFTYEISEDTVIIKRNNVDATIECTLQDGIITVIDKEDVKAKDVFEGKWEKSATSHYEFTFDGMGAYTYVNYAYVTEQNKTTKKIICEQSGVYSFSDEDANTILLDNGFEVYKVDNGLLVVKDGLFNNEEFYVANSFVGTWYYSALKYEPVTMQLLGIDEFGMGKAIVQYSSNEPYELTYDAVQNGNVITVCVYEGDFDVAQLVYNPADNTLSGTFFSETKAAYNDNAIFTLYDDFKGEWVGYVHGIDTLDFNGLGGYNIAGSSTNVASKGFVKINGETTVPYVYDHATESISFTYDDLTYFAKYDEFYDCVLILDQDDTDSQIMIREDAFSGLTFADESGNKVTFDGKGTPPMAGTATFNIGGSITSHNYYVLDSQLVQILYTEDKYVMLEVDDDGFWTLNVYDASSSVVVDSSVVYRQNPFTGVWNISKNGGELIVGEFNAFDEAAGSYNGVQITINSYSDGICFDCEGNTYYVYELAPQTLVFGDELGNYSSSICILHDTLDAWYGAYAASEGEGEVVFDGFGACQYTNGQVLFVETNKTYEYITDAYGNAIVKMNGVFVKTKACKEGAEGSYSDGNVSFVFIELDKFYNVMATDPDGVRYTFDGDGKVVNSDGIEYDYELVSTDDSGKIFTFDFTTYVMVGTQKIPLTYTAVLDCSLSVYFIEVVSADQQ